MSDRIRQVAFKAPIDFGFPGGDAGFLSTKQHGAEFTEAEHGLRIALPGNRAWQGQQVIVVVVPYSSILFWDVEPPEMDEGSNTAEKAKG